MIHLAHLSQVDCQYGSGPKPFQNNNLQFDASLLEPSWLTLCTHTGEGKCGKKCANWSHQSVARFCKLALGHDAGRIEWTHGCPRVAMRELGAPPGCFSQGCGGAPAFIELFAIRALMVSPPPHFSWLLHHWSQPANRLPNLSRDGKGAAKFVQDRRAAKVQGARIGKP
jgi:hypothetical protein